MATKVIKLEVGQVLEIGAEISVTVVHIARQAVQLEIKAPNTVPIHRGEVYEVVRRMHGRPDGKLCDP